DFAAVDAALGLPVLVGLIAVALLFDFLNGLHDAANSIATIVSTRVLRPQFAVFWAAFFNFVAFTVFGLHVAQTIGTGIIDPSIVDLRGALLGRFSGDGAYLVASDALMRRGSRDSGAQVVLMGLGHYPRSLTLWVGLGTALAQHDNTVSPAARLAFDHATRIAPDHPAPPFFEGLAYVEAGDFRTAHRYWAKALALSPPVISY
uniref:inorganic phosphate transporter n=1 Tax=Pseudomonas canadensis TaxID=915099 RepID=UPI0030D9C194